MIGITVCFDELLNRYFVSLNKNDFIFFLVLKIIKIRDNKNKFINNQDEYEELNKIKNFRRYLSNFHIYEFKYNDYTYITIEHPFQGAKISLANREEDLKFTIESNNEIGLGDGKNWFI